MGTSSPEEHAVSILSTEEYSADGTVLNTELPSVEVHKNITARE
jgi:hypothetical protein